MSNSKFFDTHVPVRPTRQQQAPLVNLADFLGGSANTGLSGSFSSSKSRKADEISSYTLFNYLAVTRVAMKGSQQFPMVGVAVDSDHNSSHRRQYLNLPIREKRKIIKQYGGFILQSMDQEIEPLSSDHPLSVLIRTVNSEDWWQSFLFELLLFLELTGESFIWMVPSNFKTENATGGLPVQLWVIPTQWVEIVYEKSGALKAYRVTPHGDTRKRRDLPPGEIFHIKFKSPMDKTRGYSPSSAGGAWIDANEAIEESRFHTFKNTINPSVWLKITDKNMIDPNDPILDRIKERWKQRAAGIVKNREPQVVPPGIDIDHEGTMTPSEMDYPDSSGEMRDNIFALRGVNKFIAGYTDGMNRAQVVSALVQFCLDEKTECLTDRGWKKQSELTTKTRIACYEPSNGSIVYRHPSKIHRLQYNGPMHKWNGQGLDILATPDHRMYVQSFEHPGQQRRPWRIRRMAKLAQTTVYRIKQAGMAACDIPEPLQLHRTRRNSKTGEKERWIDPALWMEFIGWFVSEGHTSTTLLSNKKQRRHSIGITQHKDSPHFQRIENLLSKMPVRYCRVFHPSGVCQWEISDKALCDHLVHHCGQGSRNKKIPDYVKSWPAEYLEILLNAAIDGDGVNQSQTASTYHTISKQLADDIQEIATKCGRRAFISSYDDPRREGLRYIVNISRRLERTVSAQHRSVVNYKGLVWCVTVPTGLFIVRRNGCVHVTGNCEMVINPVLGIVGGAFQERLAPLFDSRIRFWFPDCSPENREERLKELKFLFSIGGLTPNQGRNEFGFESVEHEDYEAGYLGGALVPLGVNPSDELPDDEEQSALDIYRREHLNQDQNGNGQTKEPHPESLLW